MHETHYKTTVRLKEHKITVRLEYVCTKSNVLARERKAEEQRCEVTLFAFDNYSNAAENERIFLVWLVDKLHARRVFAGTTRAV